MRLFDLRRAFLLGALLLAPSPAAWSAAAPAAPRAEAAANSTLAEGLQTWNELTQRLQHLQAENAAWEMRFNPEREDRNWWNPFWRSAAERNLQRANELSLQIHALEVQRADLENGLLDVSRQWTLILPGIAAGLSPGDRALWSAMDAWRFPIWLQRLEDVKKGWEHFNTLSPELQARRRQTLEQHWQIARDLDAYLTWRREQPAGAQPAGWAAPIQAWQSQLQSWLAAMQPRRRETANEPAAEP